ncbi:MAG: hypothetical protein HDT01_02315, partial [Bacteroidales bacterium]|nr:hypothetical protein [Bacteroidales bacterium]
TDAFIAENATYAFINREVKVISRAAVTTPLLKANGASVANGIATVEAMLNSTAMAAVKDEPVAALQLWNGQVSTTSDYVYVAGTDVQPVLLDSALVVSSKGTTYAPFYNRTKALATAAAETDAFIKQFVKLDDACNAVMVYNESLDLSKLPGLYATVNDAYKNLTQLGFYGMSYKFSLPATYNGEESSVQGNQTNQQWFVQLDGTILKVNEKNLTNGTTPAIGRTPVVRVDAYLTDNAGASRMVASAYIKIDIVKDAPAPDAPDMKPADIKLTDKSFTYHNLAATNTLVGNMTWQNVNNDIYGVAGLTSNTFWQNYGTADSEYTVTITTTDKTGKTVELAKGAATDVNTPYVLSNGGITCTTTFGSENTETANILFQVNNQVKTDLTYKNVDGKGAEYIVTIKIPSKNPKVNPDFTITQKFYVLSDCQPYTFNPNFYNPTLGLIVTKGKLVDDAWALEMNISEAFQMIDGKNIFAYATEAKNHKNVTAIDFALATKTPAQTGVSYATNAENTDGTIELTAPLAALYKDAFMQYTVTHVNTEKWTSDFTIRFNNPFKAGSSSTVILNGNEIGEVTVETAAQVNVIDANSKAIYTWDDKAEALVLSSLATDTYKVAEPTVKFTFVENAAYKTFKGNLDSTSTFEIDEATGVVTYNNQGAVLVPSYNLTVKATVTFADLSVIECEIPFTVQGQN